MTWDIDAAKVRLGIVDTDDQDEAVQSCMNIALAAAESYCDRGFMLQADEQEFTPPCGPSLLVHRYPLRSIDTLAPLDPQGNTPPDPVTVPTTWRMDKKRGIVFMGGAAQGIAPPNGQPNWIGANSGFVLGFTGGFDPLPADLEAALWMVFDNVWAVTPGMGLAGGSQTGGSGNVKSFGIDGMRIDYDTSKSAGGSGAGRVEAWGLLPASAVGILDFYRAESAALGG